MLEVCHWPRWLHGKDVLTSAFEHECVVAGSERLQRDGVLDCWEGSEGLTWNEETRSGCERIFLQMLNETNESCLLLVDGVDETGHVHHGEYLRVSTSLDAELLDVDEVSSESLPRASTPDWLVSPWADGKSSQIPEETAPEDSAPEETAPEETAPEDSVDTLREEPLGEPSVLSAPNESIGPDLALLEDDECDNLSEEYTREQLSDATLLVSTETNAINTPDDALHPILYSEESRIEPNPVRDTESQTTDPEDGSISSTTSDVLPSIELDLETEVTRLAEKDDAPVITLLGRLPPSTLKALATHRVAAPSWNGKNVSTFFQSGNVHVEQYIVDLNTYVAKDTGVEYTIERISTPRIVMEKRQGDVIRLHRHRRMAFERR